MAKVLLDIELPFLPSEFDVEEIENPITGEIANNIFGRIIINSIEYHIDYCSFSDLWWANPRQKNIFMKSFIINIFITARFPNNSVTILVS